MTGIDTELVLQEKMASMAKEYSGERPPDLPPVPLDNTVTPEDLEEIAGVGDRAVGQLDLGPKPLAICLLVFMGLGLLAQVLRLLAARPKKKA